MNPTNKAWIQIHLCVVLWGFTAILGRLITLPALPLVWWRMLAVAVILAFVPRFWRGCRALTRPLLLAYAGIGFLVALHWLTFYGSVKLSNASVGASCMALGPVFLSIVEPWLTGRRFDPRELVLGAAAVPGVLLVVGGAPVSMRAGIAVGVLSAALVAVFGALNKRLVERGDALAVTGIELGSGALLLTFLAPLFPHEGPAFPLPDARDAALLAVLALVCTLLPYTLSLVALRRLSAFGAHLVINLEPVYAIFIASVWLAEHRELSARFYVGVAVILAAVFAHPLMHRREEKAERGAATAGEIAP